jgi:hypothetical protein
VRRAGENGGVEVAGATVGFDGFLEESAEAEGLDESGTGFGLGGVEGEAAREALHGLAGLSHVGLNRGVELVGAGEVGVEGEGAAESSLGQTGLRGTTVVAELCEERAGSAEPSPGGGKCGVVGEADPEQVAGLADGFEGAVGGQFLCAGEELVGFAGDAGLAFNGKLEAVAVFGDGVDGVAVNGSGTDRLAGASGKINGWGAANFATGRLVLRYSGRVCRRD